MITNRGVNHGRLTGRSSKTFHGYSHPTALLTSSARCEKLSGCGKTILIFISRSHSQQEVAGGPSFLPSRLMPAAGILLYAEVHWS